MDVADRYSQQFFSRMGARSADEVPSRRAREEWIRNLQ